MDGQTKLMNAVMEQYLRVYLNYLQDEWADWLPMAEFTSNNHTLEMTAASPFFPNLGYEPAGNSIFQPQDPMNLTMI